MMPPTLSFLRGPWLVSGIVVGSLFMPRRAVGSVRDTGGARGVFWKQAQVVVHVNLDSLELGPQALSGCRGGHFDRNAKEARFRIKHR